MVAFPNYALIDHWNEGKVQKKIGKKDIILLLYNKDLPLGMKEETCLLSMVKRLVN